jgi:hypothetical protein
VITKERIEEVLNCPFEETAYNCHGVSLALVKSGAPEFAGRVARGHARGVGGQHSWITHGNPYDPQVKITDATLWSYDPTVENVHIQYGWHTRYMPHGGRGTIWDFGPPPRPTGEIFEIDQSNLSDFAKTFLALLGPLDAYGWIHLGNAPVWGWPAEEILTAVWESKDVRPLIPIDKIGMATKVNPHGMYW